MSLAEVVGGLVNQASGLAQVGGHAPFRPDHRRLPEAGTHDRRYVVVAGVRRAVRPRPADLADLAHAHRGSRLLLGVVLLRYLLCLRNLFDLGE